MGGVIAELAAIAFATKVRECRGPILIGTVRDILPARWATPDGRRPANSKNIDRILIVTPVRVSVEQVVKGSYTLPDIYFAVPGGWIGQDCESYHGSGTWPSFTFGIRYLYFVDYYYRPTYIGQPPVPADLRYQFHSGDYSYWIKGNNTVTIGPEWDIMGYHYDDPPRTLTVDALLREIAALLAAPGATPAR